MNEILKKLNADTTFTKPIKKEKTFTKVKDNIPLKADYNFMADILMLPTTKKGFKYLLVVVDLATDEFDIEPLKNKDPDTTLKAMKTMFKRSYIKEPYASIRTDGGAEFKGVFSKYLYDESILHRVAEPARHKQMGNVEALNKQLGRLLNGYMNSKEEETGEVYREWDEVLTIVRKELNALRRKPEKPDYIAPVPHYEIEPKFNVGDMVYRKLEIPENALGHKQNTSNFREGDYRWDKTPRKIIKVLPYGGSVPYRYVLNFMAHVSYTDKELMKAKETEEKFKVREIIGKKIEKRQTYYLIWWSGFKKSESTWEGKNQLLADGFKNIIDAYESTH